MWILFLLIADLSVVVVVNSLPQLVDTLDYSTTGSIGSTIAFDSNSPQNEIAESDFPTNHPNLSRGPADLDDLTKSTENAQMSSVQFNNPGTLFSYSPSAESSSDSNATSNADVSFGSDSSPTDSYWLAFISPDERLPDNAGDDPKIAQELLIPEVVPEIGVPRGVLPNGADVTPPVPNSPNNDPSLDWTHVEQYPILDVNEAQHPPDCTKLKGYNPRTAMCCEAGPPRLQGSKQGEVNPQKSTRRKRCILWNKSDPLCWRPVNRFCCFCKDVRKTAYDCYSPYFDDLEFPPNPKPPPNPIPGPAYRDFTYQALAELGVPVAGIPPRPGREQYDGPEGGPQGSLQGQLGGSQFHPGSCSRDYLEWLEIKVKIDPPKGKFPFVRD